MSAQGHIKVLANPRTDQYLGLKAFVASNEFPWFFIDKMTFSERPGHVNLSFLSHGFLIRPELSGNGIPTPAVNSPHFERVANVFLEITNHNGIKVNSFLRFSANCVFPQREVVSTQPHFDHHFPHKNMIIYLTGAGGKLFVEKDCHDPKEDDVVFFDGLEHYHETPSYTTGSMRRLCLVATFL